VRPWAAAKGGCKKHSAPAVAQPPPSRNAAWLQSLLAVRPAPALAFCKDQVEVTAQKEQQRGQLQERAAADSPVGVQVRKLQVAPVPCACLCCGPAACCPPGCRPPA
jgi:hypothetical protein